MSEGEDERGEGEGKGRVLTNERKERVFFELVERHS